MLYKFTKFADDIQGKVLCNCFKSSVLEEEKNANKSTFFTLTRGELTFYFFCTENEVLEVAHCDIVWAATFNMLAFSKCTLKWKNVSLDGF